MSDSEKIATAAPAPEAEVLTAPPQQAEPEATVMDEEDRLRPRFVAEVLDAVEAGDFEAAHRLVEPLHPADVADLIELARADEREGLVAALADLVEAGLLAEM